MTDEDVADRAELDALRRRAAARRIAFKASPMSVFEREMRRVMADYLEAREQGMSRDDAVQGIEAALREVGPFRLSKFQPACGACDDIGWRVLDCTQGMRCQRESCGELGADWSHIYVVPCDCSKGDPYRRSGQRVDPSAQQGLASAGKGKKRGGFSRVGR